MLHGMLAAALFGISAPLSKLLLEDVDPIALAGLLYLGAGAALGLVLLGSRALGGAEREARLERRHSLWGGQSASCETSPALSSRGRSDIVGAFHRGRRILC